MATIRMTEPTWSAVSHHLFDRPSEHFAFLLAGVTCSGGEPVFDVRDAILVPDDQVTVSLSGWELSTEAIVGVINTAVRANAALIEVHNHGGVRPRFSMTDRDGFETFPPYVLDSLPDRPYGATVWGDAAVYGEYFLADGTTGVVDSITVLGDRLRQIVSRDDDLAPVAETFDRQLPWFTAAGQRQLARLRVGVVGAGGTGSQVIQNLAYLGVRDVVIVDEEAADTTNMNRLVTATAVDLDTAKVVLGRRLVRSVAPDARVTVVPTKLQAPEALDALKGVDVVFGCLDNDGARLILNELALAYRIPYFDLSIGIDAENGGVREIGGRVAVVLPGGPCLSCMGEIDPAEAAFFLASPEEQRVQIERGYVRGMDVPAPAVVSLNAAVAAMAVNEFAVFVSGVRPVSVFTELDVLGNGRAVKSQWTTPRRESRNPTCVACLAAGLGDDTGIERYTVVRSAS